MAPVQQHTTTPELVSEYVQDKIVERCSEYNRLHKDMPRRTGIHIHTHCSKEKRRSEVSPRAFRRHVFQDNTSGRERLQEILESYLW